MCNWDHQWKGEEGSLRNSVSPRSTLTPSRDDVTLMKAAETAKSFVSVKALLSCDNGQKHLNIETYV